MKKVILYQWHAIRTGKWGWSIEEVYDDELNIYSDPFYVEIPDDFEICENNLGQKMYFREGDSQGYLLPQCMNRLSNHPCLIGGSHVEIVKLHVIGPVEG